MADDTTPDPSTDAPDDTADLGDAGKKALADERSARRAAERAAKAVQDELEKLKSESMSATEKAIAEAKAQGRKEALVTANQRLLRAEIRANAAGKMADPGDAAALLGDLDGFLDASGEPDSKAIAKAIDDLVKSKPYLRSAVLNPGDADGGGRSTGNGSGSDMNVLLRRAAGRA